MQKKAFQTRYGHYEFAVMPFRRTNAPTSYMDLMNWVCRLMLNYSVILFVDDNLVYSKSKEQNEEYLHYLFLGKDRLHAKFSIYEFWL